MEVKVHLRLDWDQSQRPDYGVVLWMGALIREIPLHLVFIILPSLPSPSQKQLGCPLTYYTWEQCIPKQAGVLVGEYQHNYCG